MPLQSRLIGEIAATVPGGMAALSDAGIDCCRDARLTLEDVSRRNGVDPSKLAVLLTAGAPSPPTIDWLAAPLATLTRFVTEKLHPAEIAVIERVSEQLALAQADHPADIALGRLRSAFAEVANNVLIHIWREDNEVFPFIEDLEKEQGTAPAPVRGAFPDPHDPLLESLRRLREMTGNDPGATALPSIGPVLTDLRAFDDMLHRHIHLESHVLYPRASALCACPVGGPEASAVLTWF